MQYHNLRRRPELGSPLQHLLQFGHGVVHVELPVPKEPLYGVCIYLPAVAGFQSLPYRCQSL